MQGLSGLGAVVLAGGRGTRMKSAHPKALHRLLGWPLAAWPVRAALEAGAAPVIVVVGDPGGAVEGAIRAALPPEDAARVRFALQAAPLGTADAVLAARAASEGSEHLFLLNGDVPLLRPETLAALAAAYDTSGRALALATCELPDGGAYGRVLRGPVGSVVAIREAKDAGPAERAVREVNVGAYLAQRERLFDALGRIDARNAQGELYLTDIVHVLVGDGRRVAGVPLRDPDEMQGVNTRAELARCGVALRDRINARWMAEGVTLEDPATTWIEPAVALAADTVIGPGAVLRGRTRVGGAARIGPGAVLEDATLEPEVTVGAHCVLERVRLPRGLVVPPLSHLARD
jgi:bifunctional UDP-N-acetylglucosamine pyrophosphorylase/glucosamine-1-phosphate N-acetyltransferase